MKKTTTKFLILLIVLSILFIAHSVAVFADETENDIALKDEEVDAADKDKKGAVNTPSGNLPIKDENGKVETIVNVIYSFSPNCIVKNDYYGMTEITTGLSPEQIISIGIDNNILDKSIYTITKDTSTTIAFDLEYLKTLSIGKHTATINYVDNNSKNESRNVIFKVEEPLATGCSPECQAQIDELKAQVESLQTQLNQLQDQFNKTQNSNTSSKSNQGAKPNNSNINDITGSNNSNLESGIITANEQTSTAIIKSSPKTGDNIFLKFFKGVAGFAISGLIVATKMSGK